MEIGCDELSALRRGFRVDSNEISSRQAYVDILSGIHGYVDTSNIDWYTRHIKGCQDDVATADLDRWAHLNIECGYRAKYYLLEIIKGYKNINHAMPMGMWATRICGMDVGNNLIDYLRRSISGVNLFEYWVKTKKRIDENQIHKIDWKTQRKAIDCSTLIREEWVSKFTSGWCATGKMIRCWGNRLTAPCPLCNAEVEDTYHILPCQAVGGFKRMGNTSSKIRRTVG